MSYLCPRPCQNKNTFGYCNTSYCIYPFIAYGGSGLEVISNRSAEPLKPKTNADRIRSMTDEELSYLILDNVDCNTRCKAYKEGCEYSDSTCRAAWLDWLKQECEE